MARLFNGSNQYYEATGSPVTAVPLTISMWFYPTATNEFYNAFFLKTSGQGNHYFGIYLNLTAASAVVGAVTNSGSDGVANSTATYTAGSWHHACAVFTSATSRAAFLNGANKGTNADNIAAPTGINQISLGGFFVSPTLYGPMDGRIANIAVYNVALVDEEVRALASGVSPLRIRSGNCVLYYPLFGNANPEVNLVRGSTAYNLTSVGAGGVPGQIDHAPIQRPFGREFGYRSIGGGITTHIIRPSADDTDGGWTTEAAGTNLYVSIDEASASDADFIRSVDNPSSDTCKIHLGDPAVAITSPIHLRVRYAKGGDGTINLTVKLFEGTTELWAKTYNDISASFTTATETNITLNQPISDETNLYVQFIATAA